MAPLGKTILLLAAATSTAFAEHLKVVFSNGGFSTISGPSGNENGHYNGFAIVRDNGEAIYDESYPAGRDPCYRYDGGRTFTIEGDCWATPRTFFCVTDFAGHPDKCEVKDGDGNSLGTSEGQTDTNFIGIAIGQDSTCVIEFDSDDVEGNACPVDDGNGPLSVTSG